MDNFDLDKPAPLSPEEQAKYRALAAKGETPSLAIVRRFIATIRKSITSSPTKTASAKRTRNAKEIVKEEDFDAF